MQLIIGNKLYSSWSMRPWVLLRAFDIPFEETVVPLDQSDTRARLLKLSPSGKVPVLVDGEKGEVVIWESLAIIEYLAEKYPDKAIWPKDAGARAHARAAASEMHSGFQALRVACPMNLGKVCAFKTYPDDVVQNVSRIEALWSTARGKFARKAPKPFLYGAFSAADAMFAPVVARLDTYQIPVEDTTRAYMDAVLEHPAVKAWVAGALAEPEAWDLAKYDEGHKVVETLERTPPPQPQPKTESGE